MRRITNHTAARIVVERSGDLPVLRLKDGHGGRESAAQGGKARLDGCGVRW